MSTTARSILIAEDEEVIRRLLEFNLTRGGFRPVLAANGRQAIERASEDLACALVDLKMPEADGMEVLHHFKQHCPDVPVLIISAVGQLKDAVKAMKAGAFEYVTKPFDLEELLALVRNAVRFGEALRENRQWRDSATSAPAGAGFVGNSPATVRLREDLARVAPLDVTVLLTGESGVGKGVLARQIHRSSRRANGPFITVSCPALPRELLESEMFGHERGSFTGAQNRRIGRIEMAAGGTLFLDEIGDLPLVLQPKLLNVLQDRQFQRVGGAEILETDIRLVAATNVDLEAKVAAREFREDLFYRLNVIPLHVPPLRERLSDIPELCERILGRIASSRSTGPIRISDSALARLGRHRWPGNVRELENTLERASAFCADGRIEERDLGMGSEAAGEPGPTAPPSALPSATPAATQPSSTAVPDQPQVGGIPLDELERLAITQTLELCGGNKAAAARRLGITEKTIHNKLTRLGLR
jgi:DNA-binding NtrC family response regulator